MIIFRSNYGLPLSWWDRNMNRLWESVNDNKLWAKIIYYLLRWLERTKESVCKRVNS